MDGDVVCFAQEKRQDLQLTILKTRMVIVMYKYMCIYIIYVIKNCGLINVI